MTNVSDNPLISVIVPVYNTEEYLGRCLDSVLGNTYKNIEVILVDDGSTDNSGKICDEYAKKDSRVNSFHQENGGQSVARNFALDICKGEYIAFIDSDDFINIDYFSSMMKSMLNNDVDMVVCDVTRDMDIEEFFSINPYDYDKGTIDKHNYILDTYKDNWERNIAPWNKLYKKHLFEDLEFPVGKGYEDAFIVYKLAFKAKNIALTDAPLYYWYKNNNSFTSKKTNPKQLVFREEALREHSTFYENIQGYEDVSIAAKRLYMYEIFFMIWELSSTYLDSKDTRKVIRYLKRKLFICIFVYKKYLDVSERLEYFERVFPHIGGKIYQIYRKCYLCKIQR